MKIKTKILWTLSGMSLLVALVGVLAVNRQHAAANSGAISEAENVAHVLSFILSESNHLAASAQNIVVKLSRVEGRDVVLVDTNQLILADAVAADIGEIFTEDPKDEVGMTLKDGRARTFVEISSDSPLPMKQVVVSVQDDVGHILGAVVLEYTPLYDELMLTTRTTIHQMIWAVAISIVSALLIAFYLGRSIAVPLQQLTAAATGFAAGRTDLPMPPPRADEIGELANAFNDMLHKRQQAEEALRLARDELELRVTARTSELANTNQALEAENAERKRAEEIARESEEKFHQLADNVTDVFYVTSPDLRKIYYFSPAYEQVWGRSTVGVYAHPTQWSDAILPEDRELVNAAFARLATTDPSINVEFRIARPDGTTRWVLSRGFQVRDSAGKVTRITGIASDITDRKRLEGQLVQSQKMETVGKLAGGVAHEFNSILTAIIGQSELLLGDLPVGSPLTKNALEISKAASRAAVLTRQLLAFGRKQILQPEVLELKLLLASMENMVRHLMGKNMDIRFISQAGLKSVKADAGQLEQVIVNIVMNAADAMPNGGKLTLEISNATLDEAYVSRFPELKAGEYVLLAITDTGPGMSEEVKARVFEPFFTTKGVGNGTGLGLATCHGIIKQSGGHIAVYSEPGRGTTFKIYLPQVQQKTREPVPPLVPAELARGTETILLVEDDPALREMAATLLRRLGYTLLTAADGVEALKLTHQPGRGHIDLLFTDVVMPHMSGKELAERVQALFPKTKILFTSAYMESAIVHQGALLPGVELLQKPFTPATLAHKVREILDTP